MKDRLEQHLHQSAVAKSELSVKAKQSICQMINVPGVTLGHELRLATERVRSLIQGEEKSFLQRLAGLRIEQLLLYSTRRMLPDTSWSEVFQT